MARPSIYSEDLADTICEKLADGKSLRAICREDEMPSTSTITKWLRDNEEFSAQYARARELQADALFDDCLDIADQYDAAREAGEGGSDHIQRARLRIDTRKWMAGKLKGKYSEKYAHEHTGKDGKPIKSITEIVLRGVEPDGNSDD